MSELVNDGCRLRVNEQTNCDEAEWTSESVDEGSKLKRLTLEGGAAVQAVLQVAFQDAVEVEAADAFQDAVEVEGAVAFQDAVEVEAAAAFQDAVEVEAVVVAPIHLRLQVHFVHLCFKRNMSGGYTFLSQKQEKTKSSGKQTVKPLFSLYCCVYCNSHVCVLAHHGMCSDYHIRHTHILALPVLLCL